ncbi:hypothetical protein ACVIHI_003424 [Bradyrhizobium sp. USDA 4524]|uniref:hypothetical protein n=1 Tax=unclassified Bradyrhizobium TaxID=2631580 RepID=UPI0020A0DCB3|nr:MULTISPECIES: hypothetical protein [unclassified Bradyrhizobium]MCP1843657.1 hypothetical protein [Bradyrhizobium sp. USDA 4538]MCP1904223.1 hypothetical protein [Bradyrhizobium sp. USDA 4537]MCP1990121.1 hypothetical protein [Bradyrhizobium sp. USDA 4539]
MTEFTVLALSARTIEPFVERVCLQKTRASDDLYRFGYRVVGTDTVVAAIEIPARLLEEAISSNLTLSCRLTPDGNVIPESSLEHGRAFPTGIWADSMPLDQLIRATLTPQNLHLEEATIANLTTLLQRLEDSAKVVRDALARCAQGAKRHGMEN